MPNKIINITITPKSGYEEPVTLADVKEWCIVTHAEHDALLAKIIVAVRKAFELYTKLVLVKSTVIVTADLQTAFFLPRGPLTAFTNIQLRTGKDTYVNLTADDFERIHEWISPLRTGIMIIEYDGGYDKNAPEDIVQAFKAEIVNRYENRGDVNKQIGLCDLAQTYLLPYINMGWL